MKKLIYALSFLLLGYIHAHGQHLVELPEQQTSYVVYLVDGSSLKGEIISWEEGEDMILKTSWTDSFFIEKNKISRVIQEDVILLEKEYPYRFKETGIYYAINASYITGNKGQRANDASGYGVSASIGKRFHRLLGIGAGVGYDVYIHNSGEHLLPVFAEFSSHIIPSNTSVFFNLQAGYSFAFTNEDYLLTEAIGGIMVYPAIGLRLGKFENKFTMDFGYKFQNATFNYQDIGDSRQGSLQDVTYRRLNNKNRTNAIDNEHEIHIHRNTSHASYYILM